MQPPCGRGGGKEREWGEMLPIHRLINLPLHEQIRCKKGWDAIVIAGAGKGLVVMPVSLFVTGF